MTETPTIKRPTPIDEEVIWDKRSTLMSRTNKHGHIMASNEAFQEVSGYTEAELYNQPHSLIRHPDMPKVVFKILWENLKGRQNFHAIIKNLSKSGKYYWVITNFEIIRNEKDEITAFVSYRKALPKSLINEHIVPLYERLLKIEKANGMEVSERYFKGFLEDRKTTYDKFIRTLLKENAEEIRAFYNNKDTDSFLTELIG
ncbi:PAS domain S-box protein [Capnocytophaga sp. oral taxon 332 str. F0381]|jgi:putative PAS/PAC sensor protein|uniref:PAS domain-containing protein n=1 Tax=Capnocytophaga sp. oral taxon 332 TaxID=712213 RepID=UPI0002A2B1E9|nr:PAS domain-containing protein [Capnocytophaga sp. oral taxon 332]EKY05081.1 PAS domain S-box protein [Capnocytophaga sp. oral taxon 332 str. F0381]